MGGREGGRYSPICGDAACPCCNRRRISYTCTINFPSKIKDRRGKIQDSLPSQRLSNPRFTLLSIPPSQGPFRATTISYVGPKIGNKVLLNELNPHVIVSGKVVIKLGPAENVRLLAKMY